MDTSSKLSGPIVQDMITETKMLEVRCISVGKRATELSKLLPSVLGCSQQKSKFQILSIVHGLIGRLAIKKKDRFLSSPSACQTSGASRNRD